MKRILFIGTALSTLAISVNAQSITDTISVGAGYAQQTYYSLETGVKGSVAKNNWDLAFDATAFGSSVQINSAAGAMVWTYPNGGITDWATLDTAGLSTWTAQYNSETSWSVGAFDKNADAANPFDLGWGIYSTTTHIITGDSLYVVKLTNGDYKKLWIKNLSGGSYNFVYANLDGTNEQTNSVNKANYTDKNFGYFSLQTNTALDREPTTTSNWDMVFTQYTTFIPTAYTVTGLLINKNVLAAKVENVANVNTFTNFASQTFDSAINKIGYNWKSFNGTAYDITDSLVYFVKNATGDVWKVVFTGFGGSANGNFIFTKQKMTTTAIKDAQKENIASLSLYPNPVVSGSNMNVVIDLKKASNNTTLSIMDAAGRLVYQHQVKTTVGLNAIAIPTNTYKAGMYYISLHVNGARVQQKVVIQ